MNQEILKKLIEIIRLQILILQIQLRIKLLKEKLTVPNLPQPRYVILHHGAGNWGFEQVNRHHTNKWGFISSLGFGMGYQKWISYIGQLYIARRDNEEGAHTVDIRRPHYWNRNSVGICLQGDFGREKPTETQLKTLKKLLDSYKQRGFILKMHHEIIPTLCPGKYLKEWFIKNYR